MPDATTGEVRSTGLTTRTMRVRNRRMLLDLLREHGVLSQADIARRTGLSRTTVSTLVSELRQMGLIVDAAAPTARAGSQGRPPTLIGLDDSAGVAVGIDLDPGQVRVAVANLAHSVLSECVRELDPGDEPATALDAAAGVVTEALGRAGVERARVIGAAMCLPVPIDRRRGTVGSASALASWRGLPVVEGMRDRLDFPVELDDDASLAALAETTWGAARGCANVIYVKYSTAIRCGLVLDGRLFRGAHGIAGEVGHTVVNESGLVCWCGSRGCLETVAGAWAIGDMLRRSHGEHMTLERVVRLAADGDVGCQRALADISRQIGIAVANLCNVLDPERIVIGGTLARGGELVLEPIRDVVRRATRLLADEPAEVVAGTLGDRAEVQGCLALVLRDTGTRFSLRAGAEPG
jgi:predicted NBD/HSP70 family sugar kinase/biotin operon repressor